MGAVRARGDRCARSAYPATFTRDVAPILFQNCASCHRPEGIAPFSLLTYQDARDHAPAILAATRDRVMPPWKPEPGYGEFADERRLTTAQIATLAHWVEGGLVEGDPKLLPSPPSWTGRWQLGTPDLVIETAPYVLRASGDDVYRNFVLPVESSGTRYIRAWEFLPALEPCVTPRCSSTPRVRRGGSMSRTPSPVTKGWSLTRR